jgi:phosphohistidine phosphatase
MRNAMIGLGLAPDIVLVSTSRRTLQTLEMLQPLPAEPQIMPMDALYLADADHLLDVLHAVAEAARSVLLIGHNPGLHDLATRLAGPARMRQQDELTRRLADGYPTGALAVFTFTGRWSDLAAGQGRLEHFFGPRDLPEFAS